jgi:Flp pilus assembly protein TadG
VESAIALPFLVLMVFGIVEVGFLFRSASVANTSSRNGVRLAAAQYGSAKDAAAQLNVLLAVKATVEKDLSNRSSTDTPVELWVYQAQSDGSPQSGVKNKMGDFGTCATPCVKFVWNGTQFNPPNGSWDTPIVCGVDHDSVGVLVRMTHKPLGFSNFLGTLTVTEHSVMQLEPPNPNTCPAGT